MNVSAINCTPIKPQTPSFNGSFADKSEDYDRVLEVTSRINDQFVESATIKRPIAAAASVGLAGLLAFASGKKLAGFVSTYAKKAPLALENALKTGSKTVQNTSKKLINENPDKLSKAKNIAGKAIKGAEDIARKGYKKLAYTGISEEVINPERAEKAFKNIGGWLGLATIFPGVCKRDTNENNVPDLLEIGANAYTGTKSKFDKAFENTSKITELVELLT